MVGVDGVRGLYVVGVDEVRGLYVVGVDRCERFVCGGCRQV